MSLAQVLAPQLQQSLALLQAPTLELKALVEQELQQNPVLEEVAIEDMEQKERTTEKDGEAVPEVPDLTEPPADLSFDSATDSTTESPEKNGDPVEDFQREFERLIQIDQEWRDHFAQANAPIRDSSDEEEKRQYMFDSLVAGTSLQESLLDQVRLSDLGEEQRAVAEMIIGNIDEYGYLKASVEEMAFATNIVPGRIQEVLKIIQTFHPPGVAARD